MKGVLPLIEAAILDVDGTLIDSNDAHAESWVQALALEGITVPFSRVRPLIGMGGDHLLPMVAGVTEGTELGKKVSEHRKKIFTDQYLPKLKAFPRTRELLERMRAEGIKLIVGSSSDTKNLHALLEQARIRDLIENSTSKDDVDESKPDPDIIIASLRKTGAPAKNVLMLGDTPYDVTAALRAGVRTVALQCGGWSVSSLARAIAVYKDPADLLVNFSSSPFSKSFSGIVHKENFVSP
jgi:HAD superfamily hydrolase (TIGR01549 family)